MQKKGELSRLAVNLLIGSLIIILGVIIWIILRGGSENNQEIFTDEKIDLKISQVKKINDNTLDLTLKRGIGEGEFVGLSFAVSDGSLVEVIRINSSMPENQTGNFSLKFISLNASRVKKVSVTPIYLNEEGLEVIGNVKDEYVTPNVCSNYCPVGAQCGINGCGMQCGNGCASGYLCLDYKCIKEKTSSSGGGSGGGSSSEEDGDETVPCTDTCLSLGYACGTRTICGSDIDCGNCTEGYSCAVNGTCIKSVVVSCGSVSCNSGEYCFNGVCLLNVSGNTYFVAVNGNDNNPGSFSQPWKTWQKAFTSTSINPGDIVYFKGGVYPMSVTNGDGYYLTRSGTPGNYIRYFNYPGQTPILDCGDVEASGTLNFGLTAYKDNIHYKGLTVRNVWQKRPEVEVVAWDVSGQNTIVENSVVYNTGGIGFRAYGGYNLSFINCDSYNNSDVLTTELPGNDGYGFHNTNLDEIDASVYYRNCRAWNNGDDGWALNDVGYVELDNCWSFGNGQLQGGGNGFKLGFTYDASPLLQRTVKNCIAANNRASGITQNLGIDYDVVNFNVYNNLIYHNGYYSGWSYPVYGIWIYNTGGTDEEELKQVFKNNIAYDDEDGTVYVNSGALYTHDHNTWDTAGITVTDSDFVSLDVNQLYAPRKEDGSLPDITFGHLIQGSDLIDKGVDVGLPYSGEAPDIGAFESNY